MGRDEDLAIIHRRLKRHSIAIYATVAFLSLFAVVSAISIQSVNTNQTQSLQSRADEPSPGSCARVSYGSIGGIGSGDIGYCRRSASWICLSGPNAGQRHGAQAPFPKSCLTESEWNKIAEEWCGCNAQEEEETPPEPPTLTPTPAIPENCEIGQQLNCTNAPDICSSLGSGWYCSPTSIFPPRSMCRNPSCPTIPGTDSTIDTDGPNIQFKNTGGESLGDTDQDNSDITTY